MAKKNSFKNVYKYDIALEDGVGAHLITWVTGLMVFFVTLALSVNFVLTTITQNWVTGLAGTLTVEIKPPLPSTDGRIAPDQQSAFDEGVKKVLWMAGQHPAVAEARALEKKEIRELIEPWLGNKAASELPLPAIIDIKLAQDADTVKLQGDILQLVPTAAIDSHTDTLDDVKTLVNTARLFVVLLTSVIILLAVFAISGIVRSKFAIHRLEVETLHLIGASDDYIARQFRRHTLQGTLKGAITGVLCMVATLIAIGTVTDTIDASIFPHVRLMPLHWALLAFSPIVIGSLIAHLTAQRTVMRALAQLP